MSSFITQALSNPIQPLRGVTSTFGLPEVAQTSNPLPTSFTSDEFGTIPLPFDNAVNDGTGASTANTPINYHYFQDKERCGPNDTMPGAFMFGRVEPRSGKYAQEHEWRSLASINKQLKHNPAWRRRYGSRRNVTLFNTEWRFIGNQIGEGGLTRSDIARNYPNVQAFNIAGRVLTNNIFIACRLNKKKVADVRQLDRLFFVLKRYEVKDELERVFQKEPVSVLGKRKHRDEEIAAAEEAALASVASKEHYWQIEPYVSTDGFAPPRHLYNGATKYGINMVVTEPGWAGDFIRVGIVDKLYSHSVISPEMVFNARKAISPDGDEGAWKHYFSLLPRVEFMSAN